MIFRQRKRFIVELYKFRGYQHKNDIKKGRGERKGIKFFRKKVQRTIYKLFAVHRN